jgi:TRAP-type C4-dicarboxylate transport system permease small subunit
MKKMLDRCETLLLYVSTFSIFLLMLLTTVDTVARYLLNRPIVGAYEITTNYLMIAGIFLAAASGYRGGTYIRVTFLIDRLPGKVKVFINYLVQIVSVLYSLMLVIATLQQAKRVFADHTALSSIDIPLWPAYVLLAAGIGFMTLLMLLDIPKVGKGESSLFKDDSPAA